MPPPADRLPGLFAELVRQVETFSDVYDRAIFFFLEMARNQFFFYVNKDGPAHQARHHKATTPWHG